MGREIFGHHDGFELTKAIRILADEPGPGGASHEYEINYDEPDGKNGRRVGFLQYQKGPRNEPGSTPGVVDLVPLAIVADRLRCFQAGPYPCRENALALTKIEEAMHWIKHRAEDRARRGVLGKSAK